MSEIVRREDRREIIADGTLRFGLDAFNTKLDSPQQTGLDG
jgi:hypothetical protein